MGVLPGAWSDRAAWARTNVVPYLAPAFEELGHCLLCFVPCSDAADWGRTCIVRETGARRGSGVYWVKIDR